MADALLSTGVAVPLAHAWLADYARRRGIRALFIKGPGLQHHGLRKPRTSSDVDVLVDPVDFDRYCDGLKGNGWGERETTFASVQYTVHSRAFIHEAWPCDIDVHRFFPGFLADPQVAFDALWERHGLMELAGVECPIPDRLGSILVLALHSLRSRSDHRRHADELEHMLATVTLDDEERHALSTLAAVTGSDHTLRDVLPRLGAPVSSSAPPPEQRQALREWDLRVASGAGTGYMWLSLIRRAPGAHRLTVLWRALWPARADLLRMHPETVDTLPGRTRTRLVRLRAGIPRGVAAMRELVRQRSPWRRRDR